MSCRWMSSWDEMSVPVRPSVGTVVESIIEKNSVETLMALVIAMIGAAIVPRTATTIRTEKKTLGDIS